MWKSLKGAHINNIYEILLFLIDVTLKLCDFHSRVPFKLTLQ